MHNQPPDRPDRYNSPMEHHPHHPAPLAVLRRHIQNTQKAVLPFLLCEVVRACMKAKVYGEKPLSEIVAALEKQYGKK